jgi:cupin fold WbuC family metalloprotein
VNMRELSREAYQSEGLIPTFSFSKHLPFLVEARKKSKRGRTRILMHPHSSSNVHEMFVLYGQETFIRANKHIDRDESVFVLAGVIDVILFEDNGQISQVVRLEASSATYSSFILLPANRYHSVIIRSEFALLFESTPGPFDPLVTVFAEWSPLEEQLDLQKVFLESVESFAEKQALVESHVANVETYLKRDSQKVFRLDGRIHMGAAEISFLTKTLVEENLDRVRICIHRDDSSELQEMFMIFSDETFVSPSFHSDKDESLLVLEGLATYVFFDSGGAVSHRVPLGPPANQLGRESYCRIPAGSIHALVVESEYVVVKETTSGPFNKSETHFPDWSPSPRNIEEIRSTNASYLAF